MDASQRSRCPSVLELFDKLQSLTRVDDRDERLWTVWFHLLQIAYFIGNVEFVNRFLLDPDPIERCMFKEALVAYVKRTKNSYLPELADRLKFIALTRSSISCSMETKDGQRMTWNPSTECHQYANRCRAFDALVHVHLLEDDRNWLECSGKTAKAFLDLRDVILHGQQEKEVRDKRVRSFMVMLARYPLMGRPTEARSDRVDFTAICQCYWAKFPLSCAFKMLQRLVPPSALSTLNDIANRYTFLGPAPKYLLAEVRGDVKQATFYRESRA